MGSVAKKALIQLQQHPLRTKAIIAGLMSAINDLISQKLTGIQKFQLRRLLLKGDNNKPLQMQLLGCAYLGPFGHFLHLILDKIFKGKKDTKTIAKKVVLELFAASWNNLIFMIYYGLAIERRPWRDVKAKIKKDYPTVMYAMWTTFPAVAWINHQFVPLQFRVIFQIIVGMCWGIFLNLRARSKALPKAE